MRLPALGLALTLAVPAAAADPSGPRPPEFWAAVVNPNAAEVARLLAEARDLQGRATQFYEPQQVTERMRLVGAALARFTRAARLDPANPDVLRDLVVAAADAGAHDQVVAATLRLRALDPAVARDLEGNLRLGVAYIKLRRGREAIDVLERVLAGEPGAPERARTLALLGYAYMAEGRLEDAIDAYDRAVRAVPFGSDLLALNGLAVAYDRDEQVARALEILEQVRHVDPAFSHVTQPAYAGTPQVPFAPASDKHYWLGLAYEAQRRLPEAAAAWRAYLGSPQPQYRRRAEDHLRRVQALLGRRAGRGGPLRRR